MDPRLVLGIQENRVNTQAEPLENVNQKTTCLRSFWWKLFILRYRIKRHLKVLNMSENPFLRRNKVPYLNLICGIHEHKPCSVLPHSLQSQKGGLVFWHKRGSLQRERCIRDILIKSLTGGRYMIMDERDAERTINSSQSCLKISDIHWCTRNSWSRMPWILLLFSSSDHCWNWFIVRHSSGCDKLELCLHQPRWLITESPVCISKNDPKMCKNEAYLQGTWCIFSVSLDVSSQISPKMCSKVSKAFKNAACFLETVCTFATCFQISAHPVHTAISGGSKPGSRTGSSSVSPHCFNGYGYTAILKVSMVSTCSSW